MASRIFALLLASAIALHAQEKPVAAPVKPEAVPKPDETPVKPDAARMKVELEWMPADFASHVQIIEKARAAGVEEVDLLLARMEASLIFGELDKLKELVPEVERQQAEIARRRGVAQGSREEVAHSLKLAKQFMALAEKRPTEVARRAEMFRLALYAQATLENARMIDGALDQLAIEKNLKDGTEVPFERIREYLKKGTQLADTGATIFGDKYGPFKLGSVPVIPSATFKKLKEYLPPDAWGEFAPKE